MAEIVKAKLSDSKVISQIGKIAFADAHQNAMSKIELKNFVSSTYDESRILDELSNPDNIYHLIKVNNTVAGFSKIILNNIHNDINETNTTKFERIYLSKEFYGQGLGNQLFNFNLELSKQNQQKGIWLTVWINNTRAIRLYEKQGFRIISTVDFPISENRSEPNYLMYLAY